MAVLRTEVIAPGIRVHVVPAERFKTVTLSLYLHRPLSPETVTPMALLPSVLARGSRDHPTLADLTRALDDLYGADLSASTVKSGEIQSASFHLDVVDARFLPDGAEVWRRAVEVLAGIVAAPLVEGGAFRDDYVLQEKVNLQRQIEGILNDKTRYANYRLVQEMCREEPFALPAVGRAEDLADITPARLLEFHGRLLREAPVDLFLVGGRDPEAYLPALREAFSWDREEPRPLPPATDARAPDEPRVVVEGQAVEQGKLAMGYRTGVRMADEDYFALQAMNGILGGFVHSKLFRNVRERESLAYYASSTADALKGILFVASGIEPDKFERVVALVGEQVSAMQEGDVSDEELVYTKRALADRLRASQDSAGAIVGTALGEILGGRRFELEERLAGIEAVTRDDVVRVAQGLRLDTIYFLTNQDDPRATAAAPAALAAAGSPSGAPATAGRPALPDEGEEARRR